MNSPCELEAYFDDELSPTERVAFEQQLARSPELRSRLQRMETVRQQLQALPRRAPQALKQRVLEQKPDGRQIRPPSGQAGGFTDLLPRLATWWIHRLPRLAAAAVGFLLLGAGYLWLSAGAPVGFEQADLAPMVADHVEVMPARGTLVTQDPQRLEKWLQPQLDFRPHLPRWGWAQLCSGRLCWIRRRKLARVRYRVEEQEFSLFVFPESQPKQRRVDLRGEFRTYYWCQAGLGYLAVIPKDLKVEI